MSCPTLLICTLAHSGSISKEAYQPEGNLSLSAQTYEGGTAHVAEAVLPGLHGDTCRMQQRHTAVCCWLPRTSNAVGTLQRVPFDSSLDSCTQVTWMQRSRCLTVCCIFTGTLPLSNVSTCAPATLVAHLWVLTAACGLESWVHCTPATPWAGA